MPWEKSKLKTLHMEAGKGTVILPGSSIDGNSLPQDLTDLQATDCLCICLQEDL